VYLGSASGLGTTPATTLTGPDGIDPMWHGGGAFGSSVASAGDVNGDGYADIVVGAYVSAHAFVYLGGPSGLATTPTTMLARPDGSTSFGRSVGSAGDVNGDGYADIVVGAYLYLGGSGGIHTSPAMTLPGGDFNDSVAGAGDVNGDGYGDVVVGATSASGVSRAYVYLGAAVIGAGPATTMDAPDGDLSGFGRSVACAGDVNGDGYADIVVGAPGGSCGTNRAHVYLGSAAGIRTTPTISIMGPDAGCFGASVASAGDGDGDGYTDVVVGAYGVGEGRAYVYLGGSGGLNTLPATTLAGAAPSGPFSNSFGYSVAPAGDIDADGHAEIIVGAPGMNSATGGAFVYLGGASGVGALASPALAGPDGASGKFGVSVGR
jgi:hypothetical protein